MSTADGAGASVGETSMETDAGGTASVTGTVKDTGAATLSSTGAASAATIGAEPTALWLTEARSMAGGADTVDSGEWCADDDDEAKERDEAEPLWSHSEPADADVSSPSVASMSAPTCADGAALGDRRLSFGKARAAA